MTGFPLVLRGLNDVAMKAVSYQRNSPCLCASQYQIECERPAYPALSCGFATVIPACAMTSNAGRKRPHAALED